jgi:hypothetical protein
MFPKLVSGRKEDRMNNGRGRATLEIERAANALLTDEVEMLKWELDATKRAREHTEAEAKQLRAALKTANSQAEHFEREWYLRGDELERLRKELAEAQQAAARWKTSAEIAEREVERARRREKRTNTNPPPTYPRPPAPPAPPPVRNYQRTDMDTLTITKPQLEAALLRWEQDARDGKTKSPEECAALPSEQVAAESAEHLWAQLGATVRA